jgi:predicted component of viral defense system (DUF524 family)
MGKKKTKGLPHIHEKKEVLLSPTLKVWLQSCNRDMYCRHSYNEGILRLYAFMVCNGSSNYMTSSNWIKRNFKCF